MMSSIGGEKKWLTSVFHMHFTLTNAASTSCKKSIDPGILKEVSTQHSKHPENCTYIYILQRIDFKLYVKWCEYWFCRFYILIILFSSEDFLSDKFADVFISCEFLNFMSYSFLCNIFTVFYPDFIFLLQESLPFSLRSLQVDDKFPT